ncbi:MAG: hypothetical protein HYZ16_07100 [Bacteroidetes bacterium]|jgi:hypothetical protein|nr:hypothetical protein [Bacteroidota bacterium]
MNFVAHYYCHHRADNHFNFGLLFPDLLGIMDRKFKLTHFERQYLGGDPALLLGIDHHKLADGLWHNGDYFTKKTAKIHKVLSLYGMDKPPYRPFFMCHVILELLIDRHLVLNMPQVANDMYEDLESINETFLSGLFNSPQRTETFKLFFARFVANRYTLSYASNEMFVYALNRLFSRANQPALPDLQMGIFVEQIDELVVQDYLTPLDEIAHVQID